MAATLKRPDVIGRRVKVDSLDDVSAALHEMAWLIHDRSAKEAKTQQRIDSIKAEAASLLLVEVDGREIPTTERLKQLEDAVLAWSADHLADHLTGKEKTLKLPHGKIVTRKLLDSVAFDGVRDEAEVIERINAQVPLLDKLNRCLSQMLGVFRLSSIIKLTASLNKPAIKTAWENQPDDRAALAALGLTLKPGEERISVEPIQYQLSAD